MKYTRLLPFIVALLIAGVASAQYWPPPSVNNPSVGGAASTAVPTATPWPGPSLNGSEQQTSANNVTVHSVNAVTNDCATLTVYNNAVATTCPVGWTQEATLAGFDGGTKNLYLCFIAYSGSPAATYTIQGTAANIFGWRYMNFHPASGGPCSFDASAQNKGSGPGLSISSLTTTHANAVLVAAVLNYSGGGQAVSLPSSIVGNNAGAVYNSSLQQFNDTGTFGTGSGYFGIAGWQIATAATVPAFPAGPRDNGTDTLAWEVFDVY